jgi:hypothetical protein
MGNEPIIHAHGKQEQQQQISNDNRFLALLPHDHENALLWRILTLDHVYAPYYSGTRHGEQQEHNHGLRVIMCLDVHFADVIICPSESSNTHLERIQCTYQIFSCGPYKN